MERAFDEDSAAKTLLYQLLDGLPVAVMLSSVPLINAGLAPVRSADSGPKAMASTRATDSITLAANASGARGGEAMDAPRKFRGVRESCDAAESSAARDISSTRRSSAGGAVGADSFRY